MTVFFCVFYFSLKIMLIEVFSQWYLFNFPLLTFSFLSGGIHNFTPTPQRSERGRKRGRERESLVWKIGVSQIHWDILMWLWLGREYVFGEFERWNWKSLYFRLHYMMQHLMDILSVCGHFWMQELMWLPKMWELKKKSESKWIRRREGETVRLTGECELEEEWMTDICISFGMWNNWIYLPLTSK